jgi:hypothetical protein
MKCLLVTCLGLAVIIAGCANSEVAKKNVPGPAIVASLPAPKVAAVRAELEAMFETDQKHRRKFVGAESDERAGILGEMAATDKANQARLREIYAEVGWPTISAFGDKAAEVAFLIVQHSTPATMKQFYDVIKQAVEKGEMRKSNFALFEDRVRMNDGRPQLYGSQITKNEAGKQVFWKIEDEANVDMRRAQMDLPPLAEYAKYFKGMDYVPLAQRALATEKMEVKPK